MRRRQLLALAIALAVSDVARRLIVSASTISRAWRTSPSPTFSPDGEYIAYSVTSSNLEADKPQTDLWRVRFHDGRAEPLTRTPEGQRMAACMEPRWPVDRVSFGSRWRGRDHAGMGLACLRRRGAQAHRLSGRGRGLCLVAGWQVSRGSGDRSGAPCGREEAAESTADRHRPFHVQGGQLRVPDREARGISTCTRSKAAR